MIYRRIRSLNEAADSSDVHIYVDEATGDYFYYDGNQLVKLGGKPKIGDRGNKALQDAEEEERRRKEEEERAKGELWGDKETDEERKARLQSIADEFSDTSSKEFTDKIKQDREEKIAARKEKEKAEIKRDEARKQRASGGVITGGIEMFKQALQRFIKTEIAPISKMQTYSRINKKYVNTNVLKKGVKKHAEHQIPSVNVYFDTSASWGQSDIQVGKGAISALDTFVEKGLVKVSLYYFANTVGTTPNQGGGTNTLAVVDHIIATNPDNVIIMTDSDGDFYRDEVYNTAVVKGSVWWLWRNYRSVNFKNHVIGRKANQQFMI